MPSLPANVFPLNPCTWAGCPWNFHQLKWGCNFGEAILSICCISRQQLMMLNYICFFCRQETVCSSVDSWSAVDSYINVQSWQEKADRNGQTCVRSNCLSARNNYASSNPSLHLQSHLCIFDPISASSISSLHLWAQNDSVWIPTGDQLPIGKSTTTHLRFSRILPTCPRKATHLDCP